jgi:16S rRNA (adenine1518-N6/adenine1519-N6)-dimethyltransferase
MTDRRPAKRSLGQNFLVDRNLQRKIVAALGAPTSAEVLEIGPGRGALTDHLVGCVRRLVLVELDDDLARGLAERYDGRPDVRVVHADVLDVDLSEHCDDPSELVVVGNIPDNITTPIVFKLLERPRPREIVLMVQDDVADRLMGPVVCSSPSRRATFGSQPRSVRARVMSGLRTFGSSSGSGL